MYDAHAKRVLPGFDPKAKIKVLNKLQKNFDIIVCLNSPDIQNHRIWKRGETYQESALKFLKKIEKETGIKPQISINLFAEEPDTIDFIKVLNNKTFKTYLRYPIEGYPNKIELVVSEQGYGRDEYIPLKHNFIVIVGLGSNSGKMSTCLGQIYHDEKHGLDSGYAKYETFPIWNLPIDHPVNIAYEAATADIGDKNVYDIFHEKAYGIKAVNYNRDLDAFPILKRMIDSIVCPANFMNNYHSPTDMGINMAKEGFVDEKAIIQASIREIERRIERYSNEVKEGFGEQIWVTHCEEYLRKAKKYKTKKNS